MNDIPTMLKDSVGCLTNSVVSQKSDDTKIFDLTVGVLIGGVNLSCSLCFCRSAILR